MNQRPGLSGREESGIYGALMVEQPHPGKGHHHAVFIGGGNDVIIPDGAARLGNIAYARLPCPFHIIAKREERIAADRYAGLCGNPRLLFLCTQNIRARLEHALPRAVRQHVLIFIGYINVYGIVPVGAAYRILEREVQDFFVLAQEPGVGLYFQRIAAQAPLDAGADTSYPPFAPQGACNGCGSADPRPHLWPDRP